MSEILGRPARANAEPPIQNGFCWPYGPDAGLLMEVRVLGIKPTEDGGKTEVEVVRTSAGSKIYRPGERYLLATRIPIAQIITTEDDKLK